MHIFPVNPDFKIWPCHVHNFLAIDSSPNNISSHVHIASRAGGKSLAFWQTLEFDLIHWAGLSSEHTYSASELN